YSRAFLAIASFFIVVGLCIATIGESLYPVHIFDAPGLAEFLSNSGLDFVQRSFTISSPSIFVPLLFLVGFGILIIAMTRFQPRIWKVTTVCLTFLFAEQYCFGLWYDTNWPELSKVRYEAGWGRSGENAAVRFVNSHVGSARYFSVTQFEYVKGTGVLGGLMNLPEKKSSLNGHEPLISDDVNRLFGFFPNGVSFFPDRLVSSNVLLSLSAVKYVIAPEGWQQASFLVQKPAIRTTTASLPMTPLRLRNWQSNEVSQSLEGDYWLQGRKTVVVNVGGT